MLRLSLAFFLTFHFAYGQISIKGKVVDQSTKKPIAYTNIGIVNTGIGTISNEDGTFSLQVPDVNLKDTLHLSAIGFGKKNISIQSFLDRDLTIYLKEQIIQLNEVTVTTKKEKNKFFELGNCRSRGGTLETDTVYAGSATALLIENVNPIQKDLSFPVYLKEARIRIFRNNLSSFKLRVRLYSVDSLTTGPGKDLLSKSIVVESSMKNGWVIFDFSEPQFLVTKPFFVAFERILTKKDRELVASGFQEFMRKHPNRLKVDTMIFEGKRQVRQRLGLSGIDLPGTFIGIAGNESAKKSTNATLERAALIHGKKCEGF
jgi:hypothetical protein